MHDRWTRWLPAAAWALVGALAGPAAAQSPQETINQYTVKAEELAARDTARLVTQELGMMRSWLNEAQSHLAQDNKEQRDRALRRVHAAAQAIEALLDQAAAEDQARQAETAAKTREQEVQKVKEEVAALEKEQSRIEREIKPVGGGT